MKERKSKKIIQYRKPIHINIGIVVFAFVMIYFLVYLFNFLTDKHISIYEVQKGQIMKTSYYTGLILRSEEVTKSAVAGKLNYYKKESDKAGFNDLICSVDKDGSISKEITAAGLDGTALSKDELLKIQSMITDYTYNQSDMQFYNVYSFKDNINAVVQENLYLSALDTLTEKMDSAVSRNTFSLISANRDGVLAFYTDGYENITPENFKAENYDPSSYVKTNLKSNASVNSGDALYKTVTNENWYMMIPITEDEASDYRSMMDEGKETFILNTIFKKDDSKTYATASVRNIDGENFLQLAFNSSMVRFISDRYMEVELGNSDDSGLKIPNSSIIEKEFLLIPEKYITQGDNSSSKGVIKVHNEKRGKGTVEFVETTVYYTDAETGMCYVDADDDLKVGDSIQRPDSADVFTIENTGTKPGVYNMNKGYAVYKIIDPVASNEEYTIVKTGTSYGLALYDRIALDGTSVNEGEFAN